MKCKLFALLLLGFLINISLADDIDNDGLDDFVEKEIGTSMLDIDTDDDGFSDGVEVELGSDPLDAKDTPSNKITGRAISNISVKNYIIGLFVITLLAQLSILFYLRRRRDRF